MLFLLDHIGPKSRNRGLPWILKIAGREALLLPMEAIGEVNGEATPGKKDTTMVMDNDG